MYKFLIMMIIQAHFNVEVMKTITSANGNITQTLFFQ